MSNLSQYSLLYAIADGALLVEETGLSMQRKSNSHAVVTVVKGYAGESPGAATCEMRIKNAIPVSGPERDMGALIAGLIPLELGIQRSDGKTARVKGFVIEDSWEQSVDQVGAYDFSWRGPIALFQ